MRANRAKDTGPEISLRKALHALGFRFRKNVQDLPGTPDVVFPRFRAVVFVHGCYWHHHEGCRRATVPKQNSGFWKEKFEANRRRDARNVEALLALGWRVGVVWECANASEGSVAVAAFLTNRTEHEFEWPPTLDTSV